MLLINPPVSRPCEAPAGMARLAGRLREAGHQISLWDANLEGFLQTIGIEPASDDTWTRRAWRDRERHIRDLRSGEAFAHPDTYARVIGDLERLLSRHPASIQGWHIGLTDLTHERLQPVRSTDLARAAIEPETNPFYRWFRHVWGNRFAGLNFDLIGISLNYLDQALTASALAGALKTLTPKSRIVMGGGLITSWLSRPGFINPWSGIVERLIAGPGEEALVRLAEEHHHGQQALRSETNSFSLLSTYSGPSENPPGRTYDFFGLPLDQYLSPGITLPVSLSHGCFWHTCSFCPETAEGNRYQPVHDDIQLLQTLTQRHHQRLLHLLDNALSPRFLRQAAEQAIGAPWYGFARFEEPLDNLDFCRALRRHGCVMLQLGLESGDQSVLDDLHKGISLDRACRILDNLKLAGIGTYVYLLFGTPAEDEASARRTLDLVARHAETIDFLNLAIFNLPIGAGEASTLDTMPFSEGDLSLYVDFKHPKGWNRAHVRRFLDREFRRHPAITPIIKRDPPAFTSSHAPFFLP
ncbi:MAG TPA: radical SAM protein [Candidatus Ozemobacteraceae bacterium]|nr:radical SAM protein [Candidatus Ozemobacteraceae bacterium]